MSAFAKAKKQTRAASMFVVVPPSAFADEWEAKPDTEVAIGLRLLSETDLQTAMRVGTRAALDAFAPDGEILDAVAYVDAANSGLVTEGIARAMCDPNDVSQPHPMFPLAQDLVPIAFTPDGARYVWDELHKQTIAQSPIQRQITDEELTLLASLLARGALAKMSPAAALAARKLLASVLEDCEGVAERLPPEETTEETG